MSFLNLRRIPAQTGAAFLLKKNERLKVTDPNGKQVSDLFCFNAKDCREVFSAGRSMDYGDSIYLSTGDHLYSNRSNKLLTIVHDDVGRHDLLMPPCCLAMFQKVAKDQNYHRSCHENLSVQLSSFGFAPDEISTTFNIFMNVIVSPKGSVKIDPPLSNAGSSIVFHAEMDIYVGLTACSHEETNAGVCKEIIYEVSLHKSIAPKNPLLGLE